MAEEVIALVKGSNPSVSANLKIPQVIKMLEHLINQSLKVDFFQTHTAFGETIPDGLVLATYERIAVEKYKGTLSRAKIPAQYISLPKGMGVYFVGPHVPNVALDNMTLTATAVSSSQIDLDWDVVENATNYVLERSLDEAFTDPVTIYSGSGLTFSDIGLEPQTIYYYRVHAEASGYNDSIYAYASAVTTLYDQLSAPDLKCFTETVTENSILCTWDAVANAESYILEQADDSGFTTNVRVIWGGTDLEFDVTGLDPDTDYYFRLKAVGSGYVDSNWTYNGNTTLPAGIFDTTFDSTFE